MSKYSERDIDELEPHYSAHVSAMTGEGLHKKSAIAAELAYRDKRIEELEGRIQESIEVYAGMDGFVPDTAPEGYCLRIIEQMHNALIATQEKE